MSTTRETRTVRVVVASPSDVEAERGVIPEILKDINTWTVPLLEFRLEPWMWETEVYPGFHLRGPQGQIDESQRIEESQIVLGMFWKRFGTPTSDANSGTEHELRKAIAAWEAKGRPHIMIYFKEKEYYPRSKEDLEQQGLVFDFRDYCKPRGIVWPYKGELEFERSVRRHLSLLMCDQRGSL
jgi:hypothetical protein